MPQGYGITINTGYEVGESNPNRSGKYGLVWPAPGKLFMRQEEAERVFEEQVEIQRRLRQDFSASLVEYGREEKTLRCVSAERASDAISASAFTPAKS